MSLGQRIAAYRKARGYSQEKLADLLSVSRQAVYKWESDLSTPELDKLIFLSQIFEVSLDELVTGNKPQLEEKDEKNSNRIKLNDTHVIIGLVLWGLGTVVSLTIGLLYGLLFFAIGLVCLLAKQYFGVKCAWAAYSWAVVYTTMAMGISASMVLHTFRWSYEMNYLRLAFAWVMFILMLIMIVVTVRTMMKSPRRNDKDAIIIGICAVLLLVIWFFPFGKIYDRIPSKYIDSAFVFWSKLISAFLSLIATWLMIIILSKLIPMIKKRCRKTND